MLYYTLLWGIVVLVYFFILIVYHEPSVLIRMLGESNYPILWATAIYT